MVIRSIMTIMTMGLMTIDGEQRLGKRGNGKANGGTIHAASGKPIATASTVKEALVPQPGTGGGSGGGASGASGLLATKGAGSNPSVSGANSPRLPGIGMGIAGGEIKGGRNGGPSDKVNGKPPGMSWAARTSEDDVD